MRAERLGSARDDTEHTEEWGSGRVSSEEARVPTEAETGAQNTIESTHTYT